MRTNSVQGSFLLAERYLEDILRNMKVFHVGFYGGTDAAAEQGAQLRILDIEPGEIRLEASFLQGAFDPIKIRQAFEQHQYKEFWRTTINRDRTIIHYHTPQGKAYIDFRPLSAQAMLLQDMLEDDSEVPEHLRLARGYLGQELEKMHRRREPLFDFINVADMYVAQNSLRIRLSEKGRKGAVTLRGNESWNYDCQEALLEISEYGYRLIAHREQHGNHQVFYRLEDGSFIELHLQEARDEEE